VAESSRINIFFTLLWCSNDSEGHSTSSCLLKETLQIKRKMDTIHMPYHTHVLGTHRFIWHVQRKTISAIVIAVTREKYLLSGKGREKKTDRKNLSSGGFFFFSFLMAGGMLTRGESCWLLKRTFVFSSSRREMTRKWKLLYVTPGYKILLTIFLADKFVL
jgi:hypothetical protein